ncbi:Histone-lysine N-methyltransferase ehmt2, partial [Elasticomyces elasticus]
MTANVGDRTLVRLLLASGRVDVVSKDSTGLTPLLHAFEKNHVEIVRLLIAHTDELDSGIGPSGLLVFAIDRAKFHMVQMLVKTQRAQLLVPAAFGVSPIGGATAMYWKPGAGLFSQRESSASFADSGRI